MGDRKRRVHGLRYESGTRIIIPYGLSSKLVSYMHRNTLMPSQVASMCIPDSRGLYPKAQSVTYFSKRGEDSRSGILFIESIRRIVESDMSTKPIVPSTKYIVWHNTGDNSYVPEYFDSLDDVEGCVATSPESPIVTKRLKVSRRICVEE